LTSAANDLEKLSRGVDTTGGAMNEMESDAKRLNAEIEKSTARIKDLHKQFAATGDSSLFGDIRKEESRLRNLEKTFKAITPDLIQAGEELGVQLGTSVTNSFGSQLSSAFSGGGAGIAVIGGAIAGLVISLGPILASELGGLVAGAVGTVGVVGGVLSAVKDPRVKSAFASFVDDIQNAFFGDHEAFVEPIRQSLALLEKDFAELHLSDAFAKVAPYVVEIAAGFGYLANNIMPGLNAALDRAGPFAFATARGLRDVGISIGYFLDRVTQSKGSLEGLKTLFAFLSGTLVGIADLIYHAGQAFDWFIQQQEKFFHGLAKVAESLGLHDISDRFDRIATAMHRLQDETPATSNAIDGLGNSFNDVADATKRFNDQAAVALGLEEDMISKSLSLSDAILAANQGWLDLNDQLIKGKGNWDDNTAAGIKNQQLLNDQIKKLDAVRQAEIAKSDGSVEAINKINAEYDKQLQKLLKVAAAAGDSKKNLEDLAKTYYIDVIVTREERNQLNKASAIDRALGVLGFASGGTVPGPVGAPRLAVVHGGERVLTPGEAASADSGGTSTTVINFNVPPGDGLGQAVIAYLAKFAQNNGGGNVQLAITGKTA